MKFGFYFRNINQFPCTVLKVRFTSGGYPKRQQDSFDIKNPKSHINRYENNLSAVKIFLFES